MLTSDEAVLFHAYWTWREIAVRAFGAAAYGFIFYTGIMGLAGCHGWRVGAFFAVFAAAIFLFMLMQRAEVLVTDRRLLIKTGHKRPPLVEVAIANIEAIGLMPALLGNGGRLSIKPRGKSPVHVAQVMGLRPLWRVLAQQAGLPPPPPFGIGMKVAYFESALFYILAAFGAAFGAAVGAGMFLIDWMTEGEGATDYILALFVVVPASITAFLVGLSLAWIVSAVSIRCIFTAAQARQLACMGYVGHDEGFEGWFMRWSVRPSLWFLGWLYGQPMRWEDKE